ncbi:MAG TPA: two-component regulator propeller domain-containing protein [Anaerolineae bacterium]|nr:two-component regulator propeller domain-containing protein [Anaerolineae bacterium]HQI83917.1 two-component regulator propeller domain-containing protein [Anaerolineae bacterium]
MIKIVAIVTAALLSLSAAVNVLAQAPDTFDVRFDHVFDMGAPGSPAFLQDNDGFLWIGSEGGGLFRWDGYTLRNYGSGADKLSGGSVFRIVADQENPDILWIGTTGGLNRFDKAIESFTHYSHDPNIPDSLSDDTIQDIVQDSQDPRILWLATTNGLNRFDKTNGTCTHYLHDPNNANTVNFPDLWRLLEDAVSPNILWIGTYGGGLDKFDKANGTFTHYTHDPADPNSLNDPDNLIDAIAQDKDNPQFLWIGSPTTGLSKFDTRTETFTHYPVTATHGEVGLIYDDGQGRLWLGGYVTDNGLTAFNKTSRTFTNYVHDPGAPRSLINNLVVNVYRDRAGILWIVTYAGKVDKLDPISQNFQLYQNIPWNENSLSDNAVTAFAEDREGMIWVGTQAGLNRFDPHSGQITRYSVADLQTTTTDYVLGLYEDSTGDFWVSLWSGPLIKLDRTSGQVIKRYPAETDGFAAIVEDPDDPNILWIGSLVAGLAKFDKRTETFTFYHQDATIPTLGPSTGYLYSVIHDRDEEVLWLGGWYGGGLNRFDKKTGRFTHYVADPADLSSLSANVVTTIYQDSRGRVWAGTQGGGLNKFDKPTQTFTRYTAEQGIPSNVNVILEDESGMLWLGTDAGLLAFDPEKEAVTQRYDDSDNLQGNLFLNGSGLKTRAGTLWLGGTNGANSFDPAKLIRNPYVPPVVLTALTHNGETLVGEHGQIPSRLEEITLDWKNNAFEFEFVVLNYTRPDRNQYAYKLEGVDENWRYVGTRRFGNYTTLPAGTYVLRLKGANNHGVWNEVGTSLKVTVIPPFWQRWWFYLAVVLLAFSGVMTIFTLRLRASEEQRRRLETLVSARTLNLEQTNSQLSYQVIERQNAEEAIRRHAQALTYLHQIIRRLTATHDLGKIAVELAHIGLNVIGTESLTVWLRDSNTGNRLQCLAAADYEIADPFAAPIHAYLAADQSLAWDAIHKGESIIINNVPDDPHYCQYQHTEAFPLRSLLITPLHVRGTTLGVLQMANKRTGDFDTNDLTLTETLAAATAIAIDNANLITELREYAADLESHIAELDAFARTVAHDLKNPLTILIGFSTVLEEDWRAISPIDVDLTLQRITRTGYKLVSIIDELLLLFTLRQTDEVRLASLDMGNIVHEAMNRLSNMISQTQADIQQPESWPQAWGQATWVEEIWMNYLSNAVKYGGRPEAEIPPRIQVGFDPPADDDDFVRFWVRDNGAGLPSTAQARLFTEFTRLDPVRTHGYGLGLSIVRRIVEKLGGTVGIESTTGEGSTFWFTLPHHDNPANRTVTAPTPPAPG